MSSGLHVNKSVIIPEDDLRWKLPADPAIGRADPTLGGFVTELSLDVTVCAGLSSQQRQRIRDRVAGFHRAGDIIVSNADGVIAVKVDWAVEYPESARVARERLAAVLRDVLAP
ncbi:hypothetical protein GCM10022225_84540 [Plantactinospora mayteni]|uniref:Uncharacterized protein n=1 Tax=Plantactinospora mayteni TaxID=566021 RepID=A0ABQ4F4Q5_9ACTN|nr:hypothetical protein [Plantactinospora mayteni]GIH01894.1 hypothetical protein Pma05_84660 [Plantactinospora mayteni]